MNFFWIKSIIWIASFLNSFVGVFETSRKFRGQHFLTRHPPFPPTQNFLLAGIYVYACAISFPFGLFYTLNSNLRAIGACLGVFKTDFLRPNPPLHNPEAIMDKIFSNFRSVLKFFLSSFWKTRKSIGLTKMRGKKLGEKSYLTRELKESFYCESGCQKKNSEITKITDNFSWGSDCPFRYMIRQFEIYLSSMSMLINNYPQGVPAEE